ncbi:MAG: ABC transporter permease subunit [Caldilineaceae bacterium]
MDIWHWTPFVTLTLLAGLTALPKEPMEQALVDGANRWQVLRYLTIPMMMPVLITTIFIRLMDALRIVDEVFMLTSAAVPVQPPSLSASTSIVSWCPRRITATARPCR